MKWNKEYTTTGAHRRRQQRRREDITRQSRRKRRRQRRQHRRQQRRQHTSRQNSRKHSRKHSRQQHRRQLQAHQEQHNHYLLLECYRPLRAHMAVLLSEQDRRYEDAGCVPVVGGVTHMPVLLSEQHSRDEEAGGVPIVGGVAVLSGLSTNSVWVVGVQLLWAVAAQSVLVWVVPMLTARGGVEVVTKCWNVSY
jgi:hypothetical protein